MTRGPLVLLLAVSLLVCAAVAASGADLPWGYWACVSCAAVPLGPPLVYVILNSFVRRWRVRSPEEVRSDRRRKGLCLSCGYDLTGNVSGVCPECGEVP